MNKKTSFILWILSLFIISNSFSCTCIGKMSVKKAVKKTDFVFIGTVVAVEKITVTQKLLGTKSCINHYYNKITFKIEIIYKGKIKTNNIEIFTGVGGGDCGYDFDSNKKYVVYANKQKIFFFEGKNEHTFLFTDICKRTTFNVRQEQIEIEKFRKPHKFST